MTFQEYHFYARGYFIRLDRQQVGIRRLYQLIWNANVPRAHRIRNGKQLSDHWPLPYVDGRGQASSTDATEERKRVFREQQQLSIENGTSRA